MNRFFLYLFLPAIVLLTTPLFAHTDVQKRFLLRQYQIGIDQRLPVLRKFQLWSVTKIGVPVLDKNWVLKIVKTAIDPSTQKPIDFGPKQDRYVKFVTIYNDAKYPVSLSSALVRTTDLRLVIQMNLYENDGKLVKILSRYGTFVGISESNFVYEAEGKYPILVTFETVTPSTNHSYMTIETKLASMLCYSLYGSEDELASYFDKASEEIIRHNDNEHAKRKEKAQTAYIPLTAPEKPEIVKAQAELKASCPLFSYQFTREYCADSYHGGQNDIKQINGFIPTKDSFTGTPLDWGTTGDRYLKFEPEWVLRRSGTNAALKDDIYGTKQAVVLVLCLYEKDGTFVKCVANGGGCMHWSAGHLFFNAENKFGTLFRTEKIKLNSGYQNNVYSYKGVTPRNPADNLSQITKFTAYDSFRQFMK